MRLTVPVLTIALASGVFMDLDRSAHAVTQPTATSEHGAPWHAGTVEDGLRDAKTRNVPVLLYWGAVWCPPCNELKSQVFNKPRFAELMAPMVAIYLDGDSEEAQAWGEKLNAKGYPTVLVLNAAGKETMRLTSSVDLGEFEAALKVATRTTRKMDEVVDLALKDQASEDDWRMLASFSWIEGEGLSLRGKDLLKARATLAAKVPATMKRDAAILAAGFAEAGAAAADQDELKALAEELRPQARTLMNRVFESTETIRAARAPLVYMSGEIMGWLYPEAGADRQAAEAKWLAAAAQLAADETLSLDIRLWAAYPKVAFQKLAAKDKPVAATLVKEIQAAVAKADAAAKTSYDRKSTISGAAYMLREVEDFDGARQLLTKELATTDTPWYIESSLASIEKAAGRPEEALKWSARASASAKGRASKLQWIVEDLALTAKTKTPGQEERLTELVRAYYETALSLGDGFQGRNATRANKVATELKPWLKTDTVAKVIRSYSAKCKSTNSCTQHFAALLN